MARDDLPAGGGGSVRSARHSQLCVARVGAGARLRVCLCHAGIRDRPCGGVAVHPIAMRAHRDMPLLADSGHSEHTHAGNPKHPDKALAR